MILPLAGIVARRLAALTVAVLLLAFAGIAAAGADTPDADGDGAEDDITVRDTMTDDVEVLSDGTEDDGDGNGEGDDAADEDDGDPADDDGEVESDDDTESSVAAQATSGDACSPMLVTHRADGSTGDELAVAITAQAQEFGVEGWVNVGWQAAEGAQLTALTITAMDGTVTTRTSDLMSGSAIDVIELRFCGSYDGEVSVDAGPPPSEEADDTVVESGSGDAPTDSSGNGSSSTGSSNGSSSTGSSSTGGSTGSSAPSTSSSTSTGDSDEVADRPDDGDEAGDDEEPLGVVTVPTPDNGNGDDHGDDDEVEDAEPASATEDEPETEVLGVQLTQDSSGDAGGGLSTAIGLLLLALVAGGGAFLGFRRLRA